MNGSRYINLNVSSGVKEIQQVKKRLTEGNIQHIFQLLANFTSFDSKGTDYNNYIQRKIVSSMKIKTDSYDNRQLALN